MKIAWKKDFFFLFLMIYICCNNLKLSNYSFLIFTTESQQQHYFAINKLNKSGLRSAKPQRWCKIHDGLIDRRYWYFHETKYQGFNARKVNCGCVYSAYIYETSSLWAEFVNKNRCISVRLVSEEDKSIQFW